MEYRRYNVTFGEARFAFFVPNDELTVSDVEQILAGNSYPLVHFPALDVRTIVDVGSNVGASALYFHAHFPEARVVSFEPSPGIFPILVKNLGAQPEIELFNYGLAAETREASLYQGNESSVQASTRQSEETNDRFERVSLRAVSEVLREAAIEGIDLLKIDTEGCEVEILGELLVGLDRPISLLYYEYHSDADRIRLDQMVNKTHLLFFSRATMSHRGSCGYVHRALAQQEPMFSYFEIR